jgi:hypothetical protein
MQAAQATPATRARRASPGHPGHPRRLRRPPRALPGHPRRRRRPQTIAEWTRQVKAERAAALARAATQTLRNPSRRLTEDDIRALITALGNLRDVIRDAGAAEKAAIYDQLDLKVTFKPGEAKIRAEVTVGPENYVEHAEQCGDTGRVRGASAPNPNVCSWVSSQSGASASDCPESPTIVTGTSANVSFL